MDLLNCCSLDFLVDTFLAGLFIYYSENSRPLTHKTFSEMINSKVISLFLFSVAFSETLALVKKWNQCFNTFIYFSAFLEKVHHEPHLFIEF